MKVRVGLDFGTHQSKICTNYQKKGNLQTHEFINFGEDDDPVFFISSKVNITKDDKIEIGDSSSNIKKSYRYFKIASAEDENFRGVSGIDQTKELYNIERYDGISPEILSIIYLTHLISIIKQKFEENHKTQKSNLKKKSILGRFLSRNNDKKIEIEDVKFEYFLQIGVPSEWTSDKFNWRRRKFEEILFIANKINETILFDEVKNFSLEQITEVIYGIYQELVKLKETKDWEDILRLNNLSAFPETAAGLTYLVKTGKIEKGFYLALDIGGGSSDISYFKVKPDKTFEYLASESFLIASNNVFEQFSILKDGIYSTEEAQNFIENTQATDIININEYSVALRKTIEKLNQRIKRVYNERVYFRFRETVANTKFKDQSCYLYGGGSLLPVPKVKEHGFMKEILLHDNGTDSISANRTIVKIEKITTLDLIQEIKPAGWEKYLPLLIVPLGLSFVQPDQTYSWNDLHYKSGEGFGSHEEKLGLFDIFKRRWV